MEQSVVLLLENLLARIEPNPNGNGFTVFGSVTKFEIEALRSAIQALREENVVAAEITPSAPQTKSNVRLNLSCLDAIEPERGSHICVDFGTAMSKAALTIDSGANDREVTIEVLRLGVAGQQQEVSETMLISSVYIRNDGTMLFGKSAVDASLSEGAISGRSRLDNIKRYLSEDGFDDYVSSAFNPTSTKVTARHLILAYLSFFAYTINHCTDELGIKRNVERRFAMPCFEEHRSTQVADVLRTMLSQAQVIADTFGERFLGGIPLAEYMEAVSQLPTESENWKMIGRHLTEPLGVANALFDEHANINGIVLVVDVGAGTTDMSLFRIHKDPAKPCDAFEAPRAARGIVQAGNYLDRLLRSYVLQKAGIGTEHPDYKSAFSRIELAVRDNKESLFQTGSVYIPVSDSDGITVTKDEFCDLGPVKTFTAKLQQTVQDMMDEVPEDWIAVASQSPAIRVVCTGGGATLPMVKALQAGEMSSRGYSFKRIGRENFPEWLEKNHSSLRADFPRTAVAIGGARKDLISYKGYANVMAGGVRGTPQLEGYYTRGS